MQRLPLAMMGVVGLLVLGGAAGCKPNAAERDPCATLNWYEPENGDLNVTEYEPYLEEVRLVMEEYNAVRGDVDFRPYGPLDGSYLALLEPLCEVDGNLTLVHLDAPDLAGLGNLRRVSGQLHIAGTELETLETGGTVPQVGVVELEGNGRLRTTAGVRVGSVMELDESAYDRTLLVTNNPELTDLEMFAEVETARAGLILEGLPSLTDLSGFRSLRNAEELKLQLRETAVGSFAGLESVETLNLLVSEQAFALSGLPQGAELTALTLVGDDERDGGCQGDSGVIDLSGLPDGTTIGSLLLMGMGVRSLQPLSAVHDVENLYVVGLNCLTSLDGLPAMAESFTAIELWDMDSLTDISALRGVKNGGYVKLERLPLLTNLEGLNDVVQLKSLRIEDTPLLSDISALSSLLVQDYRGLEPKDKSSWVTGSIGVDIHAPLASLAPLYGLTAGRYDVYTAAADRDLECALLEAALEGRGVDGWCLPWVAP